MDNEARLKYANDHFFSTGVGDGGASLGEINMRFGLAKIHYLQEQMGQAPDAVFVSAPDLTVTRNVNRWGSGYGYGGVLNWGDGSQELVILDLKPNACGMIVGGINQLVPMAELLERTHSLVLEPVEIDGIQIQWDFGKGNHFIDLFDGLTLSLHMIAVFGLPKSGSVLFMLAAPGTPGAGAPQGPDHEKRLEQQANPAREIAVQAKGIDLIDVLRDIAGEDEDEENGRDPTDGHTKAGEQNQPQPQPYLYDAGENDYEVGIQRQPRWHLRLKFRAQPGQVPDSGQQQRTS